MGPLYPADKHCALRREAWSEAKVRAGISEIARHSMDTFDVKALWPMHPLDGDSESSTDYYLGAGGVFWGISWLQRQRLIDAPKAWFPSGLEALIERNVQGQAGFPKDLAPGDSYLFGDIPLRMLLYVYRPSAPLCDLIFARLAASLQAPVSELMWGLAGSMLATMRMHALSPQERWVELYRAQADKLVTAAELIEGVGYHWRPNLYGRQHDGLGAVHGFAGNVVALLAGVPHLSDNAREFLMTRVPETLLTTVVRQGGHANWPRSTGKETPFRVYHCHGAAGIVTSLATFPRQASDELDAVLLEAGELIYAAGPLRKGPSLCHGTAGNGFALLKLYVRTGDERWLMRAREFAMHGLWQVERSRELFSQGRHSLWTGDIGVAVFLNECLVGSARFPTIDVF